jgi:hypothetical protein
MVAHKIVDARSESLPDNLQRRVGDGILNALADEFAHCGLVDHERDAFFGGAEYICDMPIDNSLPGHGILME